MEKWKKMVQLLNYYFWLVCMNFPYCYCNTIYLIIIIILSPIFCVLMGTNKKDLLLYKKKIKVKDLLPGKT